MNRFITLAPGLELPVDKAVTQRFVITGSPGSGKSNAAAVLIEAMLAHGEQVIILDPASIWWSLRLKADGKTPAFDIAVMGGEHGDIPLHAAAGAMIAETLASSTASAVLDVSDFNLTEQRRFVTDFAETFFHAKKRNRGPVIVVLEEAHEFIPQHVTGIEARMFGALKRAAKIGRNYGIGWVYLDHRPQEMNKSVINLAKTLFAFQMGGKQERKYISEWVQENASDRESLAGDLPSLPIGTAQIWSPWLGIYGKFKLPLKTTYDAGKTPERGQRAVNLKPVDIEALRTAMAAVVDDVKANDPKELKAEVARLRRELETAKRVTPAPIVKVSLPKHVEEGLEKIGDHFMGTEEIVKRQIDEMKNVGRILAEARLLFTKVMPAVRGATDGIFGRSVMIEKVPKIWPVSIGRNNLFTRGGHLSDATSAGLARGAREMLRALKMRAEPLTRGQIATLAGLAPSSGTFSNYLSILNTKGYLVRDGDTIALTPAGIEAAGPCDLLRDAKDLVAMWREKMPGKAKDILDLFAAERGPFTKSEVAKRIGLAHDSGTFSNYMSALRSNGLIRKMRGGFEVAAELAL